MMNPDLSKQTMDETALLPSLSSLPQALQNAYLAARVKNLSYSGQVSPPLAWHLFCEHKIKMIDVRSQEEIKFVGRVPGAINVVWKGGLTLVRNPRFVKDLEKVIEDRQEPALLLCRSGKRSVEAAIAAKEAGFAYLFNILEGFEGEINEQQQRGHLNGWRLNNLPWVQD